MCGRKQYWPPWWRLGPRAPHIYLANHAAVWHLSACGLHLEIVQQYPFGHCGVVFHLDSVVFCLAPFVFIIRPLNTGEYSFFTQPLLCATYPQAHVPPWWRTPLYHTELNFTATLTRVYTIFAAEHYAHDLGHKQERRAAVTTADPAKHLPSFMKIMADLANCLHRWVQEK